MNKNETAPKKGRAKKIVGIVLAAIIAIVAIVYLVPLFTVLAGEKTEINGQPEVMLILGYRLDGPEMPSLLKSRLDAAIGYLEEHPDMTVIVSGGKGDGEHMSEAQCMYDYLTSSGIPADKILTEDRSASTAENIRFTRELIEERGIDVQKGVLVVSNEFHLHRVRMLWKRLYRDAPLSTLAAPSTPSSQKALMHLREPFALLADFLTAR